MQRLPVLADTPGNCCINERRRGKPVSSRSGWNSQAKGLCAGSLWKTPRVRLPTGQTSGRWSS